MYGINRLTCIPDSTAKIQTSLQTKNNSLSFFAVRPCLRNFAPNMIFNCKGTTLFSITKQSGGKTWRSSSRCVLYIYILFVRIRLIRVRFYFNTFSISCIIASTLSQPPCQLRRRHLGIQPPDYRPVHSLAKPPNEPSFSVTFHIFQIK